MLWTVDPIPFDFRSEMEILWRTIDLLKSNNQKSKKEYSPFGWMPLRCIRMEAVCEINDSTENVCTKRLNECVMGSWIHILDILSVNRQNYRAFRYQLNRNAYAHEWKTNKKHTQKLSQLSLCFVGNFWQILIGLWCMYIHTFQPAHPNSVYILIDCVNI